MCLTSKNNLIYFVVIALFFLTIKLQELKRYDQEYDQNNNDSVSVLDSELQFKNRSSRQFFSSKNELALTGMVKINPAHCDKNNQIAIFIHSVAQTSGHYYERRQTLRNTWVSEAKSKNISVFFVIGLHHGQNDSQTQNMLENESRKHQDIIQFAFVDNYYNLTLKAISILEWINKYCNNSKTILKTDDDVIVNVDNLIEMSEHFEEDFVGYLLNAEKPFRNKDSVWFMPEDIYPDDIYPYYMRGSAYLMNTRIVGPLLTAIHNNSEFILDIDDMFITGIMASKVGLSRKNSHKFHLNSSCDVPVCDMYSYVVLGECNTNQIYSEVWLDWKSSSPDICQSRTVIFVLSLLLLVFIFMLISILLVLIFLKVYNKPNRKMKYSSMV